MVFSIRFDCSDMPLMSHEDFSCHTNDCPHVGDAMRLTDLPEEVTSIDDLECDCWDAYDSLEEIE